MEQFKRHTWTKTKKNEKQNIDGTPEITVAQKWEKNVSCTIVLQNNKLRMVVKALNNKVAYYEKK